MRAKTYTFQHQKSLLQNSNPYELNMSQNKRLQILLWQYRECASDRRTRIKITWEVPSLTMAINTFLGVLYLGYARNIAEARIVVLLASLSFTIVSLITLIKHRFLASARTRDLSWIQEELKKEVENIREIKWITKDIIEDRVGYPNLPRYWTDRRSSYSWLRGILVISVITLVSLLLWEIIQLMLSVN